jgi:hypothetical protein
MTRPDLSRMLSRAEDSLTAAISCVDTDPDAAVDDMFAARLLVASALLAIQQGTIFVG